MNTVFVIRSLVLATTAAFMLAAMGCGDSQPDPKSPSATPHSSKNGDPAERRPMR